MPTIRFYHHPLSGHAHLRAWLSRIEALPRFVGMVRNPTLA